MARNGNAAPRASGGGEEQGDQPWIEDYPDISGAATKGSGEKESRQRDFSPLPTQSDASQLSAAPASSSHEVRPRASAYALPRDLASRFSVRAAAGFVSRSVDSTATFHAVETAKLDKQTHVAALCRFIPSIRTLGWSSNTSEHGVSCRHCVARLRRLESEAS